MIHHQGVICCVAFGRFSLRRIAYTPQSALLPHTTAGSSMRRLASNTLLVPRALQNPLPLVHKEKSHGGFWSLRADVKRDLSAAWPPKRDLRHAASYRLVQIPMTFRGPLESLKLGTRFEGVGAIIWVDISPLKQYEMVSKGMSLDNNDFKWAEENLK